MILLEEAPVFILENRDEVSYYITVINLVLIGLDFIMEDENDKDIYLFPPLLSSL